MKWCENYILVYVKHVLHQHKVEILYCVVLCCVGFAMVTENFLEQIVLIKKHSTILYWTVYIKEIQSTGTSSNDASKWSMVWNVGNMKHIETPCAMDCTKAAHLLALLLHTLKHGGRGFPSHGNNLLKRKGSRIDYGEWRGTNSKSKNT